MLPGYCSNAITTSCPARDGQVCHHYTAADDHFIARLGHAFPLFNLRSRLSSAASVGPQG